VRALYPKASFLHRKATHIPTHKMRFTNLISTPHKKSLWIFSISSQRVFGEFSILHVVVKNSAQHRFINSKPPNKTKTVLLPTTQPILNLTYIIRLNFSLVVLPGTMLASKYVTTMSVLTWVKSVWFKMSSQSFWSTFLEKSIFNLFNERLQTM
jgi:hypothetical protein